MRNWRVGGTPADASEMDAGLSAAAAILLTGVYGPGYAPAEFFYGRF